LFIWGLAGKVQTKIQKNQKLIKKKAEKSVPMVLTAQL
jgi:hypothetical protein